MEEETSLEYEGWGTNDRVDSLSVAAPEGRLVK